MSLGREDPSETQCDMPYCYKKFAKSGPVALLVGVTEKK